MDFHRLHSWLLGQRIYMVIRTSSDVVLPDQFSPIAFEGLHDFLAFDFLAFDFFRFP